MSLCSMFGINRCIASLSPGSRETSFSGLIANITEHKIDSKSPQSARGCLQLLLVDRSGKIVVKLWYADITYNLLLGQTVNILTTHISSTTTTGLSAVALQALPATLATSIFTEKDKGSSIGIANIAQDSRQGCDLFRTSPHTTTLAGCLGGCDGETRAVKLLVMVIDVATPRTGRANHPAQFQRSMLTNKAISKSNKVFRTLDLTVIDHSSLSSLTPLDILPTFLSFSPTLFATASSFIPRQTVLLIIHPSPLASHHRIRLTQRSQIYVDPPIPETLLLRKWTSRLFPPQPTPQNESQQARASISHLTEILNKQTQNRLSRPQYTLSLFLDKIDLYHQYKNLTRPPWRHKDPSFTGYISVLITRISLVELYHQSRFFHGSCRTCNTEIFANTPITSHVCRTTLPDVKKSGDGGSSSNEDDTTKHTTMTPTETVTLSWNNDILSGISDETAGLIVQSHNLNLNKNVRQRRHGHNLLLTDEAVLGLTGLQRSDFEGSEACEEITTEIQRKRKRQDVKETILDRLRSIEAQILWERVTLVLGWSEVCLNDDGGGDENGDGQDFIVVLRVLS